MSAVHGAEGALPTALQSGAHHLPRFAAFHLVSPHMLHDGKLQHLVHSRLSISPKTIKQEMHVRMQGKEEAHDNGNQLDFERPTRISGHMKETKVHKPNPGAITPPLLLHIQCKFNTCINGTEGMLVATPGFRQRFGTIVTDTIVFQINTGDRRVALQCLAKRFGTSSTDTIGT